MNMHKNQIENELGSGTVLKTFLGVEGLERIYEKSLFELRVLGREGARAMRVANTKYQTKAKNKQFQSYNICNLAFLLGENQATISRILGEAEISRDVNSDYRDIYYLSKGFGLTYSKKNKAVVLLTFFAKIAQFNPYPHALPLSLKWGFSVKDVLLQHGVPEVNEIQSGMRVLVYKAKRFLFDFNPKGLRLQRV